MVGGGGRELGRPRTPRPGIAPETSGYLSIAKGRLGGSKRDAGLEG